MTEAENLISKGLRAVTYTKSETKKGERSTQEESTMIAKRESEHFTHLFVGLRQNKGEVHELKDI